MNKVMLIGRLGKNPELRFAAGTGKGVAKFSVAVTRQFKRDEVDFINCVAFGKQAETIAQYFQQGSQIALTGHIQTGSYNAKDGSKRYTTDIFIESFEFVGDKKNNNQGNANTTFDNGFNDNNFDDDMTPIDNGDLPF